jgi:hypothetical protein
MHVIESCRLPSASLVWMFMVAKRLYSTLESEQILFVLPTTVVQLNPYNYNR